MRPWLSWIVTVQIRKLEKSDGESEFVMNSDGKTDTGRHADPQRAKRNGVFHARVFGKCTSRCIYTSYRRQGANIILMVRNFARRFEALKRLRSACGSAGGAWGIHATAHAFIISRKPSSVSNPGVFNGAESPFSQRKPRHCFERDLFSRMCLLLIPCSNSHKILMCRRSIRLKKNELRTRCKWNVWTWL